MLLSSYKTIPTIFLSIFFLQFNLPFWLLLYQFYTITQTCAKYHVFYMQHMHETVFLHESYVKVKVKVKVKAGKIRKSMYKLTGVLLSPQLDLRPDVFCLIVRGHIAAGRITSMKSSNDPTGNRTRGLPACSAVPLSERDNSVCTCNYWERDCGFQTHR